MIIFLKNRFLIRIHLAGVFGAIGTSSLSITMVNFIYFKKKKFTTET